MPYPQATHDPTPDAGGALSGEPVVSLRGVDFGYEPGVPVIRSVTGRLESGRVCALIGPNASGKTTLLKLLLGQLSPWSGSVTLLGRPIGATSYRRRAASVSYVPQKGLMSFAFTVRQVVAMGRYAMGDAGGAGDAVDEALHVCDLSHLAGRVYSQLSGGQQQRVLLARAVAQSVGSGRLMLLDEPASGMDLKHVHQTMRLLRRIAHGDHPDTRGPGPAVLVVLHDVNLAARYADDVWLMDEGELIAAGPSYDVMRPDRLAAVYGVSFVPILPPDKPGAGVEDGEVPGIGTQTRRCPVFWIDPPDTID